MHLQKSVQLLGCISNCTAALFPRTPADGAPSATQCPERGYDCCAPGIFQILLVLFMMSAMPLRRPIAVTLRPAAP